jgi:hypothetical protein
MVVAERSAPAREALGQEKSAKSLGKIGLDTDSQQR